jgi:Cdc6-like AAA superfamily ATPase
MEMINMHDLFSPGQEILDPTRFSGRRETIKQAIKVLCRQGTSMIVYGERGVGKTSFIEMIKLIAQDQVELIHRHKLQNLRPPSGFQYKVISIECDDDVDDTGKVLQRLITSPEGIKSILGPRIEKMESTIKDKAAVKLFKGALNLSSEYEEKLVGTDFKEESIYELFTNLIISITQSVLEPDEGLLIAIDEFDKVKDNSKMASIIKTLSKNKVKFLISGIASSYTDLIKHHASIERQLFDGRIKINQMEDTEIENIFHLAENNSGGMIKFESRFVAEVKKRSHGFPYYAQLFGQLGLDRYVEVYGQSKKGVVTLDHLMQGLTEFAKYDPKLDQIYLSSISNDPSREILLRALSMQLPYRIKQSNAFEYCRKRGLAKPEPFLPILLGLRNPQVIMRIDKEYLYFIDPIFKIYTSTRTPITLKQNGSEYLFPNGD